MKKCRFTLSPTQYDFVKSKAFVNWLIGPQGEGKTFAGAIGMIDHIQTCQAANDKTYVIRAIIVRDSFENIKRMTIPSIKEVFGILGVSHKYIFSDGGRQLDGPGIHCDLMGIADQGALSKIQGGEYALVWLEEPAPISDKGNSGLPQEVFDIGLGRTGRQPGSIPRLQVTMNPADEDHWTYHKAIEDPINPIGEPLTYPDIPEITTFVLNIPYGENESLPTISRAAAKAAYKDRPDLWQRYIEGEWAFVQMGAKVINEYNEKVHKSKFVLNPLEGLQVVRLWDAGLNPTCIFYQQSSRGFVRITDTLVGENMGMKQFVNTQVIPLMARRYGKITKWRDIGDPASCQRAQGDSTVIASKIIEELLGTTFEVGPVRWEVRREAVKQLFNIMIDGEPMVKISSHEGFLHRALRGGWHYKVDNSGKVINDGPVKDMCSHPGDALSYGIAIMHPWKPARRPKRNKGAIHNRANSYSVKKLRRITHA